MLFANMKIKTRFRTFREILSEEGVIMQHVHFNAGSCGDVDNSNPNSQSAGNTAVRANIINRCYSIDDETSRPPDTMSLVEAMTIDRLQKTLYPYSRADRVFLAFSELQKMVK